MKARLYKALRVCLRFLAKSEENIKKAQDYLNYLSFYNRNRKRKN